MRALVATTNKYIRINELIEITESCAVHPPIALASGRVAKTNKTNLGNEHLFAGLKINKTINQIEKYLEVLALHKTKKT